jgi:hypothetical protein
MTRLLIRCLLFNLACIVASGMLLRFYPKTNGFTVGTHYLEGGVFLGTTLLCLVDSMIGVYLAWSMFHQH